MTWHGNTARSYLLEYSLKTADVRDIWRPCICLEESWPSQTLPSSRSAMWMARMRILFGTFAGVTFFCVCWLSLCFCSDFLFLFSVSLKKTDVSWCFDDSWRVSPSTAVLRWFVYRYNADATRSGSKQMLPIPWNFAWALFCTKNIFRGGFGGVV